MQDLLFTLGLVLFLLGLLTGLAIPVLKNPRMGVSSHLVGMTNGPFLIVVGLLWPKLNLSHAWEVVTVVLLAYSSYANWLATQLGALWGAGHQFAPGATGEHRASPTKEHAVDLLLVTLAPVMVAATVLLIVGVLR
ncbi:MAG: hab [Marmoricola sp.]|nr:hab [Marmoricola sp.]